uniref:chromosome partition protein Smc-like isoform X1 n=1 Tax=Styela clava TaxID=7725 RepID=UPI001939A95F|nr:chromosome partition protein Smc-like isoform X1 [Styela clava]
MARYHLIIALYLSSVTIITKGQEEILNCRPKKGCKMDVKCEATTEGFNILEYLEKSQFPLTCQSKSRGTKSGSEIGIDLSGVFKMVTKSISEINIIKNELNNLRKTNSQLKGQLAKNQEAQKLFQMELYQLGDVNKNQSDVLNTFRTLIGRQNKDIKQLRGRSTELTVELMNLKKFKTDTENGLKAMKDNHKTQIDKMKENLEKQKEENEKIKNSSDFATKRLEEIQTDYEFFREESMNMWETTSKSVAVLKKENEELKKEMSNMQTSNGELDITIDKINKKVQQEITKFQNKQNEVTNKKREEIQKEITDIRDTNVNQVNILKKEHEDIKKELKFVREASNKKIESMEKEKMEMEKEIRDLRNETEQYIGTIQTMKSYLDDVKQKLYGFEEKVKEANDKLSRFSNKDFNGQIKSATPTTTTTTSQSTTTVQTTTANMPKPTSVSESTDDLDTCQMLIDGVCYWSEVHPIWDTDYKKAVSICTSHSSVIADVPNAESYQKISDYLRKVIPIGWNYIQIWTAKEINPPTGKIEPEDSFTKWYQHFPKKGRPYAEYTNIYLIIKRDVKDPNHGMANYPPTFSRNGVLCRREN